MNSFTSEEAIRRVLTKTSSIAVVGLSPNPRRPSHDVARYLQSAGFRIIPVNPGHDGILGQPCYSSLTDIPEEVDTVNVFRNPKYLEPIVDDAITIGAKHLWLQIGVVNESMALKARDAGLIVVMDRCLKVEHLHQDRGAESY